MARYGFLDVLAGLLQGRARFALSVDRIVFDLRTSRQATVVVLSVRITNSGEAAHVSDWEAIYLRGAEAEEMEILDAAVPWIEEREGNVSVSTAWDQVGVIAQSPIRPGGTAEGKLVLSLDGDRCTELASLDFCIMLYVSYPDGRRVSVRVDPTQVTTERVSIRPQSGDRRT